MTSRGITSFLATLVGIAVTSSLALAADPVLQPKRLAILDLRTASSLQDEIGRLLSDVVRAAGRDVLPADGYVVMTRENVQELLPPGTSLPDCVGECAVEVGRRIQADYVVSGEVLQFPGQLRGTLSLYDCRTANLLGQAGARGATMDQFETDLLNETTSLLLVLPDAARDQRGLRRQAAVDFREGCRARARLNRWIMVGAVAAGGYAAYAHVQSNSAWDDYSSAGSIEDAATAWDRYTNQAHQRDVALGVTGAFVGWRLWRAFRGGPTDEECYRDLLLKNRLSLDVAPRGAGVRVILLAGKF